MSAAKGSGGTGDRAPSLANEDRERLRLISEQLPAVLWTTDRTLAFTSAVGRALANLRHEPDSPPIRTVVDLFGTTDRSFPPLAAHLRALEGASVSYEIPFGTRYWICHVEPLKDSTGAIVGVIGIGSDATELKETERALRETEGRFDSLARTIREVFWLAEPGTGRLLYASPAFESIWGRKPDELMVNPARFLEWIHPADRDRIFERQPSAAEGWQIEYRIVRPDGSVRWVRDRGFPALDGAGRVVRLAGLTEDITDRRRLEDQYREAQKMDALGRLAGGVAHDFNNTLTAILACAEELATHDLDADERRGLARQIVQSCEQAAEVTRHLLLFSRRRPSERRRLELNEVVQRLAAMLRRIIGEPILLELRLAPDLGATMADAGHLEQVVLNLVLNARDALPTGGSIEIATDNVVLEPDHGRAPLPPGAYVGLWVSDSGTGITRDVLPHIFEPFFTTKEPGKGTGLGLAIVHGIVEQAGGHVNVVSEPGRGARFEILLPATTEPPRAPLPLRAEPAPAHGNEVVLLAEDDEPIRRLVRRTLEGAGYRVMAAADGLQAFHLLKRAPEAFDLLITDVVMPRMGGVELAAAARRLRPTLEVLFITGYTGDGTLEGAGGAPPRVLEKPFAMASLLEGVRAALDGRSSGG